MRNRSRLFILTAALGGCLVLLACAATIGFAGFFVLSNGNPLAAFAAPTLNRIVYIGPDRNIYVADADAQHKAQVTKDADGATTLGYSLPTWSPDDRRIAFVALHYANGDAKDGTLYAADPNGARVTALYRSDQYLPFYLYWSPDNRHITFLTEKDTNTLALRVATSDQQDSMQELLSGAPLFFAWSPDGQRLFTHIGGTRDDSSDAQLALLPFNQKAAVRALASSPGTFQTPEWAPDGKHVLFSSEDASHKLVLAKANGQGENPETLLEYQGRISFSWSPSGDKIAYIVTDPNLNLPNFGNVFVVDADGKNKQDASGEHALAFFWSPNGKRLAFLTVQLTPGNSSYRMRGAAQASTNPISVQWKVKDFETGKITVAASFSPTEDFIGVLPFFDQYARSATFWSPDSQSLVYSNDDAKNGPTVWVADARGTKAPRQIAEGTIAFWSWK